jgi:NhaA family Na+:H+ antiporter
VKLTKLFAEFFDNERSSGIVLVLCAIASLSIANSLLGNSYIELWHTKIGLDVGGIHLKYSLDHWINDGLMAVFFLLIGLEIEREIYVGELSDLKNATLPIFAAIGGMMFPALIHFLLNRGSETQSGFGVPMATDIAFALGMLALLGKKIPLSLKVFLTALAIIDDLGAILVIALFYVGDFSLGYFLLSIGIFVGLLIINRRGVQRLAYYLIPGFFMWYFMLQSGVHATLAGVMLAFAIPFGDGNEKSPSYILQHALDKPVPFIIVPLFALANTGIVLGDEWVKNITSMNSMGVFLGLFLGKPLGISLFGLLAVKFGLAQLPVDVSWKHILGAGFLGGIGFTMSIFITFLAFADVGVVNSTKISILLTSLLAGGTGYIILSRNSTSQLNTNVSSKG